VTGFTSSARFPRTATASVLLCTDLHAGNVLAGPRRPWLLIDPKPYIGDPHYDLLQHLLNCADLATQPTRPPSPRSRLSRARRRPNGAVALSPVRSRQSRLALTRRCRQAPQAIGTYRKRNAHRVSRGAGGGLRFGEMLLPCAVVVVVRPRSSAACSCWLWSVSW
jgi:hypothetical protein